MAIKFTMVSYLPQVMKAIRDGAERQMLEAVNEVRNETVKTLSGTRKGRKYFVPGTKRLYTASAPGEPPAAPTGTLKGSVKWEVESKLGVIIGQVGTPLKKGLKLEFGDRKIKPRPWLGVSFKKSEEKVKDILGARWVK